MEKICQDYQEVYRYFWGKARAASSVNVSDGLLIKIIMNEAIIYSRRICGVEFAYNFFQYVGKEFNKFGLGISSV